MKVMGLSGRARKVAAEVVGFVERLDEEDGESEAFAYDAVATLIRLRDELLTAPKFNPEDDASEAE